MKMGMKLKGSVKKSLEEFLKASTNIVAYNATEIPEVDLNTLVHDLNIKEHYKLIK